jgi:hypothetical protein
MGVVVLLEVIDVEHHGRQVFANDLLLPEYWLDFLVEVAAVAKAGKRIQLCPVLGTSEFPMEADLLLADLLLCFQLHSFNANFGRGKRLEQRVDLFRDACGLVPVSQFGDAGSLRASNGATEPFGQVAKRERDLTLMPTP